MKTSRHFWADQQAIGDIVCIWVSIRCQRGNEPRSARSVLYYTKMSTNGSLKAKKFEVARGAWAVDVEVPWWMVRNIQ